jgi:hypothetical protein
MRAYRLSALCIAILVMAATATAGNVDDLNGALGYFFCDEGEVDEGLFDGSTYNKNVFNLGIGLEASF